MLTTFVFASYKVDIYQAFVTADMTKWKQTIDKMEKEPTKTSVLLLELVNYQYGYIGWCLGVKREKEAQAYLEKAEKSVELLASKSYKPAVMHAYKSMFFGFRVMMAPIKAPILGVKCLNNNETAMKLDKSNPFVVMQYANILYYKPKMFGGSKEEALQYYIKSEKLMEANPALIENDWNYLNLLATISRIYQQTGQSEKSKAYIEKALQIEPRFTWIKNDRRPSLKVDM
jgi:hypothetical protein